MFSYHGSWVELSEGSVESQRVGRALGVTTVPAKPEICGPIRQNQLGIT